MVAQNTKIMYSPCRWDSSNLRRCEGQRESGGRERERECERERCRGRERGCRSHLAVTVRRWLSRIYIYIYVCVYIHMYMGRFFFFACGVTICYLRLLSPALFCCVCLCCVCVFVSMYYVICNL